MSDDSKLRRPEDDIEILNIIAKVVANERLILSLLEETSVVIKELRRPEDDTEILNSLRRPEDDTEILNIMAGVVQNGRAFLSLLEHRPDPGQERLAVVRNIVDNDGRVLAFIKKLPVLSEEYRKRLSEASQNNSELSDSLSN